MQAHLSIGLVFAGAWRLFRGHNFTIILFSLVQSIWIFIQSFRMLLMTYIPPFKALFIPEVGFGAKAAAGVLFLLGSMGITIACANRGAAAKPGRIFLHRTLPALIDSVACLGLLAIVPGIEAVVFLALQPFSISGVHGVLVPDTMHLVGTLMMLAVRLLSFPAQLVVWGMIFVIFPSSVLERGWPLYAIRRSFQLTRGQRWRIVAITLLLVAIYSIGAVAYALVETHYMGVEDFSSVFTTGPLFTARYMGLPALRSLLIWLFTLFVTLIIASSYQQLTRLKDGPDVSEAVAQFD